MGFENCNKRHCETPPITKQTQLIQSAQKPPNTFKLSPSVFSVHGHTLHFVVGDKRPSPLHFAQLVA